jgi:hypothetical protein
MPAILGITSVLLGLALILADEHVSRAVWRRAGGLRQRSHARADPVRGGRRGADHLAALTAVSPSA